MLFSVLKAMKLLLMSKFASFLVDFSIFREIFEFF